jgi:hypothetical protein
MLWLFKVMGIYARRVASISNHIWLGSQIKGGVSYWKMVYGNIHYVMTNVFIFDLVRIMEVILVCYEQFIHCTKIFVTFYDFRVYLSLFTHSKG